YKTAIEYINKAIEIDDDYAKAYFMKAYLYKETQDTANAIKNFQIATEKDQNYFNAYVELGILFAAKRNPLAIDYYNNALNINPRSREAWYNKAMFYQENEMYNEALESYTTLIEIDPNYKYAYYNLGYIHLEYLKITDVARDYFSKAIQCDPNYVEAYFNRGLCFEILGDINNAQKDYQKALQLRTNYQKAIEGLNRLDEIMKR
ncbi:tetratricopeptide repeat protein, partial [Bacteroidota bacterium]